MILIYMYGLCLRLMLIFVCMYLVDGIEFWFWFLDDFEFVDVEMIEEVKVKLEEASLKISFKVKLI